jgi:hypothetical protein
MLSDTLFKAIQEITCYQKEMPECYNDSREHLEIVKTVMHSLQQVLDTPPLLVGAKVADALSQDQRRWWRACCEANIARWVERLRLLGPVSSEELIEKLGGAIERQDALMKNERDNTADAPSLRSEFIECLHFWFFLGDLKPVLRRLTPLLPLIEQDGHMLPVDYADWLGLPAAATFADGVRAVREKLRPAEEDDVQREVFRLACQCWNNEASRTAGVAMEDILADNPDFAGELVAPMMGCSEFWLEQIARAAFDLPPDHTGDYDDLLSEGKRALADRRSSESSDNL